MRNDGVVPTPRRTLFQGIVAMSTGRLVLIIFLSAFMGGATSLGGWYAWQQQFTTPVTNAAAVPALPEHLASTDPTSAKARPAHIPQQVEEALAGSNIGAVASPPTEGADPEERIITTVYAKSAPAVVHIQTTSYIPTFFGGNQTARGSGSGVIINREGYILTNTHVVQGAGGQTQLRVKTQDGREYDATFKGIDVDTDLAVIKLTDPPADLPVAQIGNSEKLKVGQRAIVIGNPYGFDSSVSVGVVSALNRTIQTEQQRFEGMIQTDAAVNPGNSGGPMLNSLGQVIGINTVIYSQSGGSQGIGFAIPINAAMRIVDDLIKFGQVRRPWLGVRGLIPMGPRLARLLRLTVDYGALVQEVVPGSPGAKAGLRGGSDTIGLGNGDYLVTGGDVILAVDGIRITRADQVLQLIRRMEAGQVVTLDILRDNKVIQIRVTLESAPVVQQTQ
ncbi:MAG: hypothetical protein GEEBNDBF_02540 [bacterium]|nr:hypothetical protein [bacterium]